MTAKGVGGLLSSASAAVGRYQFLGAEPQLSTSRPVPLPRQMCDVISVCNFTLSIIGITVSVHLMVKRKSRITLQAHGLVVSLALLISVILSAAMVILDNVASKYLHFLLH